MATQVQNRRGTTAEHSTFTGAVGELTVDTTKDTVVVHDGAVAGGRPLLREDQSNLPTSAPTTGIYNASGSLAISTGGSPRVTVTSTGVGIGTTGPLDSVSVASANYRGLTLETSTLANRPTITFRNTAGSGNSAYIQGNNSEIAFGRVNQDYGGHTESARLDGSGRLLVGTSSSTNTGSLLQLRVDNTNYHAEFLRSADSSGGPALRLSKSRGSTASPTEVSSGDQLGAIVFSGHDGVAYQEAAYIIAEADGTWTDGGDTTDNPSRLVFSTTADGASSPTERMRIASNGVWTAFNDGVYNFRTAQAASGAAAGIDLTHSSTGIGNGTLSFRVFTNGNVVNTNNSYGAISDLKLKENIVDATSQWSDIKALQVRKYNFKEGQTHTQIGLIAQEVELVSPGLVTESPDRDVEGNDLGTVTKSVNYSVLYMKAVKALQEAMERIETLEAKVAALESA